MLTNRGMVVGFCLMVCFAMRAEAAYRMLGDRFAAELDGRGNAVVLIDLSYPDFSRPATIGRVGGNEFKLRAADRLMPLSTRKHAISAELLDHPLLEPGWWKLVPWKRRLDAAALQAGPEAFRLDDIDFGAIARKRGRFRKAIARLEKLGLPLSAFEFRRLAGGAYELRWRPLEPLTSDAGPAREIANLKSLSRNFTGPMARELALDAVGATVGLIPVPVVAALLGTALDRVILFRNDLLEMHEDMASELLALSEEHAVPASPFDALTVAERDRLGRALYLSHLSVSRFWQLWDWITQGSRRAWRKNLASELDHARSCERRLDHRHEPYQLLGARFALNPAGIAPQHLYNLGLDANEPVIALDYAHPGRILRGRDMIEAASTAVDFATRFVPVPLLGGVTSSLFDFFVRTPMVRRMRWESRLLVALEERTVQRGEHWETEIRLLDQQRLNPFELRQEEVASLVAERKKRLGL